MRTRIQRFHPILPREDVASIRRFWSEDGQVIVVVLLCSVVLVGFMALAIDVGQLLYTKRQLQTAADAAALAGALEIKPCNNTPNCTAMQTAAQAALTENGFTGAAFLKQCSGTAGSGVTLELNNGPCALSSGDPNSGDANYVEALVSKKQSSIFGGVLGVGSVQLTARAEAGLGSPTFCVNILSASASNALLVNGNGNMAAQCGVMVDSSSSTALLVNGSATLTASAIDVHGGDLINGNPTVSPNPTTQVAAQPDPLAGLPVPSLGTCGTTNASPFTGAPAQVTVNSNKTAVFNPGTYCGGLQINGNATATFNPGLYIIEGNMIVNGNDTISGNGVTFYFSTGSLTMNGNSHASLVAPTTGTYAGILLFESRTDASTVIVNGDSTSVWQGALYAADAQLLLNGGSNLAAYTILVSNTLTVNGNNQFTVGNDYSSLPGGAPISGTNAYLME